MPNGSRNGTFCHTHQSTLVGVSLLMKPDLRPSPHECGAPRQAGVAFSFLGRSSTLDPSRPPTPPAADVRPCAGPLTQICQTCMVLGQLASASQQCMTTGHASEGANDCELINPRTSPAFPGAHLVRCRDARPGVPHFQRPASVARSAGSSRLTPKACFVCSACRVAEGAIARRSPCLAALPKLPLKS